jgi:NADH:ubiquinone oxidoreductase subunit C
MELKKDFFFIEYLIKMLPKVIKKIWIYKNDLIISLKNQIKNKEFINIFKILKNHYHFYFKQLADMTVIDFLGKKSRFSLFYNLLNLEKNKRLFIKYDIFYKKNEFIAYNISINQIFLSSIWLEREIWDMYGIIFFYNKDLRRILTDYGFKGHPLRKDFPLVGFLELAFDILTKTLKYVPVELSQDYRKFQFISSWENI